MRIIVHRFLTQPVFVADLNAVYRPANRYFTSYTIV